MNSAPHTDDGVPITTRSGRPPKGNMTDNELAAIVPILAKPRKARGGSLEAAAHKISEMRGAHEALTPATRLARQISARWVSHQLAKRGIPGKKGIQAKVAADPQWRGSGQKVGGTDSSGPRMGCEIPPGLSEPPANLAGVNRQEAGSPVGDLEVAKGGPA